MTLIASSKGIKVYANKNGSINVIRTNKGRKITQIYQTQGGFRNNFNKPSYNRQKQLQKSLYNPIYKGYWKHPKPLIYHRPHAPVAGTPQRPGRYNLRRYGTPLKLLSPEPE